MLNFVEFNNYYWFLRYNNSTLVPEAFFYSFSATFATWTTSFILFLIGTKGWELMMKRKPLVKTVGILTFMPSAFDRCFWLEDIFNCSMSNMIGWIKYLWGCDWSKEHDIFDSCKVLSKGESEILDDLDQRLSFLSAWRFDQRFALQISK